MQIPIEDSRVYKWAARDTLAVLDANFDFPVKFVDEDGRLEEGVKVMIDKCVESKQPEFKVCYLDTNDGLGHEQTALAYRRLFEAYKNLNMGTFGKNRFYSAVGEMIYHALNMRLPDHIFNLGPDVRWKVSRDIDIHITDLEFSLDNEIRPVGASNALIVKQHALDFSHLIIDDVASGYVRGNGYACNPLPLNMAYDQAGNYIIRLLLSLV